MNILSRIFHGKVAKLSRDKQPPTGQATAKRFATSPHPSTRSPPRHGPKASHPAPGLIRPPSTSRGRNPARESHFDDETHIKQEEDESFAMELQYRHYNMYDTWGDQRDDLNEDGQQDMMDQDDGQEDELDDGEDEWHDVDSHEYEGQGEDATETSQALTADETESSNWYLNSDEPMSSIEDDEELYQPIRFSPYLHGKNKKTDRADPSNPEVETEDEPFDEGFEAELEGEREDGLLIHEDDLRDYLRHKRATPGASNWPSEACRLYKLLYLRGLYPVMPLDWEWPLSRVHPMPAQLFMPMDSDDQALIRAEKSAFHAEKALRRLFELHIRISGHRLCDRRELAAPLITKEIKAFVKWAEQDGGFLKKLDYVSPVFVIPYNDAQTASSGQTVVEKCQSVAQEYRAEYARRGVEDYPRMVYVFVVIQHIVLVMGVDTTEREIEQEPFPVAELDVSNKTHWLDYSLGITIPVMLARQSLVGHRWAFPEVEVVESDPDA